VAQILASLEERDVLGTCYAEGVMAPEDRRRWNQARLVALAVHHAFVPSMLVGEYTQELYMMAGSIYRQSRDSFPSGTDEELASEIATAVESGWL
jgi:hypothetical protein